MKIVDSYTWFKQNPNPTIEQLIVRSVQMSQARAEEEGGTSSSLYYELFDDICRIMIEKAHLDGDELQSTVEDVVADTQGMEY